MDIALEFVRGSTHANPSGLKYVDLRSEMHCEIDVLLSEKNRQTKLPVHLPQCRRDVMANFRGELNGGLVHDRQTGARHQGASK